MMNQLLLSFAEGDHQDSLDHIEEKKGSMQISFSIKWGTATRNMYTSCNNFNDVLYTRVQATVQKAEGGPD